MIRALAIAAATATLASACTCSNDWAYFPDTLPYTLPDVQPGAHLSESQAIELANWVAVYHRRDPAKYSTPQARFKDGQWFIHFNPVTPPPAAFGADFAVHINERNNTFSFSPGR
jgi:hypothetical protein